MKIWNTYGSEHSANIVMIGKFKEISDAEDVKKTIDSLTEQVRKDEQEGFIIFGKGTERYSDEMVDLLGRLKIHSISSIELEQFAYDVDVDLKKKEIILKTQEVDVSAFLKLFVEKGAKVEVYSSHDYPETDI